MALSHMTNPHLCLAASMLATQPRRGESDNRYLAIAVGTECRISGGDYTVTADDVAAELSAIPTGLPSTLTSFCIRVLRAGDTATADAKAWADGLSLLVASGLEYRLAPGDKVEWMAFGT